MVGLSAASRPVPGEPQAAATPDTIRKMVALGADVAVEPGAGTKSGFSMPTVPPPAPQWRPTLSTAPKSCCKCVGRPPKEVRRYYANFTYQAGSWSKPRRMIAKVEWHPGELYPRVGFIVTNMSRPAKRVVAF
jgi:hypothetical protein